MKYEDLEIGKVYTSPSKMIKGKWYKITDIKDDHWLIKFSHINNEYNKETIKSSEHCENKKHSIRQANFGSVNCHRFKEVDQDYLKNWLPKNHPDLQMENLIIDNFEIY